MVEAYMRRGAVLFLGSGPPSFLSAAFPKGVEEGAKVRCWGADDALRGFSKSRGSPPCPPTPAPQTASVPVLGAAVGALRKLRGRAGRAGESRLGRAPEAPRTLPRPLPVPAPGRRRSARSPPARALAAPAASPGPELRRRLAAHPSACQPRGPCCRARAPSLAGAGTVAARGRVLTPTMRGELWLLVLVLRESARALSPEPGAGRTGQSWPRGPVAAGRGVGDAGRG